MDNLKIDRARSTLVDQVEEKLIQYFKEQGLRAGSSIPNETDLANSLGIGRTVLREALSRFKMTGMIESRTKRGMILAEPSILSSMKRCVNPLLMSADTLRDLFEFRIIIEIGMTDALFANITPKGIKDLEKIVNRDEAEEREHPSNDYCDFHEKIYQICGNNVIEEFQLVLIPALEYVMAAHNEEFEAAESKMAADGQWITHKDLLELIKKGDKKGYSEAIRKHFSPYEKYLQTKNTSK